MSLPLRISIFIGFIAIALSSVVSVINYHLQTQRDLAQSQLVINAIMDDRIGAAAMSVYLMNPEYASQIVAQLSKNQLINFAEIVAHDQSLALAGKIQSQRNWISADLPSPMDANEIIGQIIIEKDVASIEHNSTLESMQTAWVLIGLSALIAVFVGIYVSLSLTSPLRELADALERIDTSKPEEMANVDINHYRQDEIGKLLLKTNVLISALKSRFLSEKVLTKTTEELQKRFRLLFEQATAGIALLSEKDEITTANPSFKGLFVETALKRDFAAFFDHPNEVREHLKALRTSACDTHIAADLKSSKDGQARYLHCVFSSILDDRQQPRDEGQSLIEVIVYDVTQRREKEIMARYEADHDHLTGILNRRAGLANLQAQYNHAVAKRHLFVLMMIDLDNFKPVNDTYGHEAGDKVLRVISSRIQELVEGTESNLIRWGGDEFLLGLTISDDYSIEVLAQKLLNSIQQDVFLYASIAIQVGASIGIIRTLQDQAQNVEELIAKADDLMYSMKSAGRNKFKISTVF